MTHYHNMITKHSNMAPSSKLKCWIEAMRLRTLPVSTAGVVMGCTLTISADVFNPAPALLCLAFALLAQIASNFANEYFDWRSGLDRKGRVGPRRGVTEGDIAPQTMLRASIATLAVACVAGCALIYFGGWLLLPVGIVTAVGAMAYSAGPYPLSRHGLGEVAVILFFGIVPVNFVYYIMAHSFTLNVALCSLGIGLMSADILIVNNYRDYSDDRAVNKHTLTVIIGPKYSRLLYIILAWTGVALCLPALYNAAAFPSLIPFILYVILSGVLWIQLYKRSAQELNPLLGLTAMNLLAFTLISLLIVVI